MIINPTDIKLELDREEAKVLQHVESQYVIEPSSCIDDVAEIASYGDQQAGDDLCWDNVSRIIKFRPAELSIWAGINGHGKSEALGQAMLWEMKHKKVLIASLEMKPKQTLFRMACQYAGCHPSPGFVRETMGKFDGRLWIYNQLDTVASSRILALVNIAKEKYNVDHIVIDSLTKCGLGHEDYTAEKDFIDRLQEAAKRTGLHIHLVCHIRKGSNEAEIPNKFSIKGSGAISDMPDNVYVVWRNKIKEEASRKLNNNISLSTQEEKFLEMPDTLICVEKNREGGEEGKAGLYFHKPSKQYKTRENGVMRSPF